MEDTQLDYKQPLLSVRRFSSTTVPELKSCSIRNSGSIPFQWEQIPGRLKEEGKSRTQSYEWLPIAPKLPPERISNIKQKDLEKGSEGRRKNRLSCAGKVLLGSQTAYSSDLNATKCDSSIEAESFSSEDDNVARVDVLDTLSWSESFFFSGNISSVSGLTESEIKPSGRFSSDQWSQDFLMARFLPAAEAIVSEARQRTNRRPLPKQYSPEKLQFPPYKLEEYDDEDDSSGLLHSRPPPKPLLVSRLKRALPTWSCFGRNNYTKIEAFKNRRCLS